MTRNNELFALANEYQKIVGLKVFRAILGDVDGRVDVQGQDGYVYVRYQNANGFSQPMVVPFRVSNMKKTPGMGVLIKYDYDKVWAVVGADYPALLAQGTNPTVNNTADDNNSYYINQYRITTLVSHPISSAANSMIVTVQPFLAIIDGVVTLFMGDQVDLTASIPASTGKWGIACIFWKPSDNTLEVVISTPKDNQTDLGIDDVQECLDGRSDSTNIPVWAWQVFHGQTGITPGNIQAGGDDFLDLRQFINVVDSASGGSGTVTSVALTAAPSSVFNVSGSPVTTAGTLALSMDDQAANKVLAGPTTGADAAPGFRALVNADIPQPLTLVSPVINTGVSGTAIDNDPTLAANSSTLLATQQAAKAYTDQAILGIAPKADVRLATAAALATNIYANGTAGVGATLTGFATGVLTVDGVTVAINDRILVKDEVTQANNGIYKCTVAGAIGVAYVLTRTTDGDTDTELRGAWMVSVFGSVNSQQAWVNTNASAITFGSTAITWGEFSAGVITAGTGLTKTGNSIALTTPVALANGGTHADLSATGGTSQFLKQSSVGANVTVGTIASADITTALTTPPAIGGTTPGTGAFTDLSTTTFEDFAEASTPSTPASDHARIWVADDQGFTVQKYIDSGGQIFYNGRDLWIICRNTSGSTITKGTWLAVNGQSNGYPSITLADANNISTNSQNVLAQGVAMDTATNNSYFRFMIYGVLDNFDTSGFSAGAQLWLSTTAGTASSSPAAAGVGWAQYLGRVLVSNASTGAIQVDILPPYFSQIFASTVAIGQGSGAAGIDFYCTSGKLSLNSPSSVGANRTVAFVDASGTVVLEDNTTTLSNKKLQDSTVTFADNGDNTKQIAFQASGITTATTRTITMPDSNIDLGNLNATTITAGTLSESRLPHKFAVIEDQQAQNTAGGGSAATTWTTRVLNTEIADADNIVTISSNKFTPISGSYRITVNSPFVVNTQASFRLRLRNVTTTTVIFTGNNHLQLANGGVNLTFTTEFTANGTDEYDIQYYTTVARATNGLGLAVNETSAVERYTQVLLEKIA